MYIKTAKITQNSITISKVLKDRRQDVMYNFTFGKM